jgi:hypothetical protein
VKTLFAANEERRWITIHYQLGANDGFDSLPARLFDEADYAAEIGSVGESECVVAEVRSVRD